MVQRALLVGCNYPGTESPLEGCVNDVLGWQDILKEAYGFEDENIQIMIDTDEAYDRPTGKNIKDALRRLVAASQDGDVLFFSFSGHGSQIPDDDESEEEDRQDEAIFGTDFNPIIDDDMREILGPLHPGCKFTFSADSCHSGGLLDHEAVAIGGSGKDADEPVDTAAREIETDGLKLKDRFLPVGVLIGALKAYLRKQAIELGKELAYKALEVEKAIADKAMKMAKETASRAVRSLLYMAFGEDASNVAAKYKSKSRTLEYVSPGVKPPVEKRNDPNKGILITGCQAEETSADVTTKGGDNFGAFSNSIQTVIKAHHKEHPGKKITNQELVHKVRALMRPDYKQNPGLECSQENAASSFLVF